MAPPKTSQVFAVHRRQPEFIKPATPTPHEFKQLSDIDDQDTLRFNISPVWFYGHNPSVTGKDPVKVIREALAKALVFYYPLAGRLKEWSERKLVVECTGEGIVFIEADAEATIDDFGDSLQPPFPCFEELLFYVPGTAGVINSPLLLTQVTRLKCGGFIFANRFNHTMVDGFGIMKFLSAVAEMARGVSFPSIIPVWERHLLRARVPLRVTCTHKSYETISNSNPTIHETDDSVHESFFFGQAEISRLRELVPSSPPYATTFELLTACLWKCRTIALQYDPFEEVRLICIANIQQKKGSALPRGYYGNAFAFLTAVATAGDVTNKPFSDLVNMVKKVKEEVTMEYMASLACLLKLKGRPHCTVTRSYCASDLTNLGFDNLDLGWGKPIYGGPADCGDGSISRYSSFYVPFKNKEGEKGIVVPIFLPKEAMKRFKMELKSMSGADNQIIGGKRYSKCINSAL